MSAPAGRTPLARHAAGFVVAPLVVPLLGVAVELVRIATRHAPPGYEAALIRDAIAVGTTRIAPLAYATTLVLGTPILLSLRAAHRLTLPWIVAVSTAVGAVVSAAVAVAITLDEESSGCASAMPAESLVGGLAMGAVLGAVVSAVHCAVARVPLRAPRPEHSTATSPSSP